MSATLPYPKLKSTPPLWREFPIYYPDSDGQPMAENDPQYHCITDTRFALTQFLKATPDVYVGADLLVYFVKGDPTRSVAPDVLVAFGVRPGLRRSYKIWEEGKTPDVIFEFASEGTWEADLGWKKGLYMGIGVKEYFLFDPSGDFFDPLLQGYRLSHNRAEPLSFLPAVRGELGLYSESLNLELWARPNDDPDMPYVLRLYDPAAESWLLAPAETEAARQQAEIRATAEATARQALESELARLQAELARLRGEG
ncbi:MAG: Uma2 family endonuclease [Chloroflexota bacterium]